MSYKDQSFLNKHLKRNIIDDIKVFFLSVNVIIEMYLSADIEWSDFQGKFRKYNTNSAKGENVHVAKKGDLYAKEKFKYSLHN